jgi:hypothetical protein
LPAVVRDTTKAEALAKAGGFGSVLRAPRCFFDFYGFDDFNDFYDFNGLAIAAVLCPLSSDISDEASAKSEAQVQVDAPCCSWCPLFSDTF